ncbi:hypothetical protein [Pararobbsia alpina]|uniref:hypothetical protein n=1 Tax=Pararobbsia alpina TaxID=621374 RepID=UPI001C2EA946|nr:hypothetical protein [Pararobbsia alpina]
MLTDEERDELTTLLRSKLTSVRLAQRERIVLLTADGKQNKDITGHLGVANHPRLNMHFTPTSASWLNIVEHSFRDIITARRRRGVLELVAPSMSSSPITTPTPNRSSGPGAHATPYRRSFARIAA